MKGAHSWVDVVVRPVSVILGLSVPRYFGINYVKPQ